MGAGWKPGKRSRLGVDLRRPAGSIRHRHPQRRPRRAAAEEKHPRTPPESHVAETGSGAAPMRPAKAAACSREVGCCQSGTGGVASLASTDCHLGIVLGVGLGGLTIMYAIFTFARLEIFKMLLSSFFPLASSFSRCWIDRFRLAQHRPRPLPSDRRASAGGHLRAPCLSGEKDTPDIHDLAAPLAAHLRIGALVPLVQVRGARLRLPMRNRWMSIIATAVWCVISVWQVKLGTTV